MYRIDLWPVAPCLLAACACLSIRATTQVAQSPQRTVTLASSVPSPALVGDVVTWTATDSDANASNLWYRFRVRYLGQVPSFCATVPAVTAGSSCLGGDFVVVRDYGPENTLDWTAGEHEGEYAIEVSSRNNDTGDVSVAQTHFRFAARAIDTPTISETDNPLVYRYSAAPCASGSRMRVEFQSPDGFLQNTPFKSCDGAMTMNFYLAGMRADTTYSVQQLVDDGSQTTAGPGLTLTTGDLPLAFGHYTLVQPPPEPVLDPILLQSRFGMPVATDWMGNVIWYYPGSISFLARPEPGGMFLGWYEDQAMDQSHQILREFDLSGTTNRETNAARISEQLVAMGMHPINAFHHEVRYLPDGKVLALAASERILTDVQGPGPVDVIGDTIVALDSNLQVVWAWDAFDHLDPHRLATNNETCNQASNGCAPIYLAAQANDWTHGNSVALMADGSLLYSARHQDWVIKIDYNNGQGGGDVLWRLGKDGDFQIIGDDPYPWFSHQHDANIDANGLLTVFDNGNLRFLFNPEAHSRGQAIQIDEQNRTATLVLNADLGDFSVALGSARKLPNGDYHFHLGDILANSTARAVEVDPAGHVVYDMHIDELQYRSFRLGGLY